MAKRITKTYDQEFKSQAVKLAQEISGHKAADELGVPSGTIYAWVKAFKEERLEVKTAVIKGKISFYCKSLGVTGQGFHNYYFMCPLIL